MQFFDSDCTALKAVALSLAAVVLYGSGSVALIEALLLLRAVALSLAAAVLLH